MDIRWDLTQLYTGHDDPKIDEHLKTAARNAEAVATHFKGRIASLEASQVLTLIQQLEDLRYLTWRPVWYAGLSFDADTTEANAKALLDRTHLAATRVNQFLTFAELEFAALPDEVLHVWLEFEPLREYRHSLESARRWKPHQLSELEEQLAAKKALTGRNAWAQLYTEISASIRIPVEVDGRIMELTADQVRALRTRPERALRQRAMTALYDAYRERQHVLTFAFNTLYQDWALETETRHYENVLGPTALGDEIPGSSIESLFQATREHRGLLQDFFKLKAKALQLDDFSSFDLLAPLSSTSKTYPYPEAQALVLEAFAKFDGRLVEITKGFFDGNRVDVNPRAGKRGGAYCSSVHPRDPAFLLLNHNDRLDDVFTLAHELGHGIHAELSRVQKPSNYGHSTPLAETASIFCEMLLADHLLEHADEATRRDLLQDLLEKAVTTLYRQVQITRWELSAHAERANGIVSGERFGELWLESFQETYGDGVRVTDGDRWGWITIPHVVSYRFYCYSYAYGMLIVLALFNLYKQQGQAFVPKYLDFLASGNSATPQELMTRLGVDLEDAEFWNGGFKVIQGWLEGFEALI